MIWKLLIIAPFVGWYLQAGHEPHLQAPTMHTQVPLSVVQGDQEDSDILQPAMGYGALEWPIQH